MSNQQPSEKKQSNPYGQIGLAMSIPMMLLSGPLVGYGLGWLIRHYLGWGPWITWVMVLLGTAAGIRETVLVIRKLS